MELPTNTTVTTPAVANGVVYLGTDYFGIYALDANTGALVWQVRTGDVNYYSASVANGVVFVASGNNTMYAFDAGTGQAKWSQILKFGSAPAVVNGAVYVGSFGDSGIYAFSLPSQ